MSLRTIGHGKSELEAYVERAVAAQDYTTNRYHRPKNEYDPTWDWTGALQDVGLFYTFERQLAGSDAWPNWYPTAEFRSICDQSRANASGGR